MDTEMIEAGPSRPRRASQPSTPRQSTSEERLGSADADNGDASRPGTSSRRDPSHPASPETAFAARRPGNSHSDTPPPDDPPGNRSEPAGGLASVVSPHLDLASYPTSTLLRLIANLLQQIAGANDQIRSEPDEMEEDSSISSGAPDHSQSSRSASRASSHAPQPQPSPKAALFSEREDSATERPPGSSGPATHGGIDPSSPLPLFTASRTSLVHPSSLLSFHARHVPSISIEAYLLRILKYCPTTNEVFLSLLVYFDRMSRLGTAAGVGAGLVLRNGKGFAIDSYNVHRLVIAGVTVASKFFSDVFYTNSRYAKVGGLPPHELNQLELQFLLLNDFRLAVPTEEMQRYGDRLLGYWQGREEETGVDVDSGRELSENGKRRLRERREKEHADKVAQALQEAQNGRISGGKEGVNEDRQTASGSMPKEEDAHQAMASARADGNGEAGEAMDVDVGPTPNPEPVNGESDSHPVDPAQPPPDVDTASAPATPRDGSGTGSAHRTTVPSGGPPFHSVASPSASVPAPPTDISMAATPASQVAETPAVPVPSGNIRTAPQISPRSSVAPQPIINGTRAKERERQGSFSTHQSSATAAGQRSLSFSRPAGTPGIADCDTTPPDTAGPWDKGDRGVVVGGVS